MNKKKWFIMNKKADFKGLAKTYGLSPITIRCIINRDVKPNEIGKFISGSVKDLYAPDKLMNARLAAEEIKVAIDTGKKIRVIGDYDVDGETATIILTTGIKKCGGNVDYAVPDRIIDGYGLNENLIRKANEDGVEVIITCDNGIAAYSQIELANELGITTIITDHHEVPFINKENGDKEYIIPNAKVVVDPKQNGETYPQIGICGAVVAFKVISILYSLYCVPTKELDELLMFASLATVCDVMELKDENRLIVREGLRILNNSTNVGMKALIEACSLTGKTVTSGHLGFIVGPTCNAAGRLKSASLAIELFFEEDTEIAAEKAMQLRLINENRKNMTEVKTLEAINTIETTSLKDDKIILVKIDDCHESIAGIIAGRIREHYNKPSVVFTDAHECGIKGSGRSIEAYNMFEEFNKHRDIFVKFGGHAMAAGMSLASIDDLNTLRKILNEETTLTEEDFCEITHVDMELPIEYATLDLAKELLLMEPFGVGNSKPLFAVRDLTIIEAYEMGKNHNAMKYFVRTKNGHYGIFYDFGDIDKFIGHLKEKYGEDVMDKLRKHNESSGVVETIAYTISVNSYNAD